MTLIDAIQEEEKLVNLSATESEKFKRYDELIDKVRQLIDSGADVNAKEEFFGESALMLANSAKIVRMLIEAGADINARDHCGGTPLMKASLIQNLEKVKLLVDSGADVTAKDHFGDDAISLALIGQKSAHVKFGIIKPETCAEIIHLLKNAAKNVGEKE
ncbi:MAG: ankyrin repeat domain-containing protein [Elusimicrobiaceae bacterium]|nr:ankyrin repeat domain-containing protein [Elusimicrobiaceae bacterium]